MSIKKAAQKHTLPAEELSRVRKEMVGTVVGAYEMWEGEYNRCREEFVKDPLSALRRQGEKLADHGCRLEASKWLVDHLNGQSTQFTDQQFGEFLVEEEKDLTNRLLNSTGFEARSSSPIDRLLTVSEWKAKQTVLQMVKVVLWWRRRIDQLELMVATGETEASKIQNPHTRW